MPSRKRATRKAKKEPPPDNIKEVLITVEDGEIHVDPDPVELSKSRHEEAEWHCLDDSVDFKVIFYKEHEDPFDFRHFHKTRRRSGRPKVQADPSHPYPYVVVVDGKATDPDVIIND